VLGQVFATDQAAFPVGYLAVALTQTGKVVTFGGIQTPPVPIFMDGFVLGVEYYNQVKGTDVQVLGWDPIS
jgi:basic membrane protein A